MPILHWLNREKHINAAGQVPYRLLEPDDAHSAGDSDSPNMLIQGDNLDALKALLPYYPGGAKCIYIDPPFNTEQALANYDRELEDRFDLEAIKKAKEESRESIPWEEVKKTLLKRPPANGPS